MPVVGTVDVAVHLHRVHNIDLFCRGVYHLRASLLRCSKHAGNEGGSVGSGGEKKGNGGSKGAENLQVEAHGIPYMCLAQCEDMGTTVSRRKVPPLKEPRLHGPTVNGHHYHSRMFVIRYRDEELELGEVVNFHVPIELDAGRRWLEAGQTLVLQMELMFSKLAALEMENFPARKATKGAGGSSAGGGGDGAEGDVEEEEEEEEVLTLEPVAVQHFEVALSGGHWGLHAYVPVTFSGVHFIRVDCMVHGVLRNLKLEAPEPGQEESAAPTEAEAGAEASGRNQPSSLAPSQDEPAVRGGDEDDEPVPASLGRLGLRGDECADSAVEGASTGAATTMETSPSSPPKFTWFSLYDAQGVGGRRISIRRIAGSSTIGSGAAGRCENVGKSRDDKADGSSGKAEGSWMWGWRRKGSGISTTPKEEPPAPDGGGGGTVETAGDAQAVAAAAAGEALSPAAGTDESSACHSGGKGEQGVTRCSEVVRDDSNGDEEGKLEEVAQRVGVLLALRDISSSLDGEEGADTAPRRRLAARIEDKKQRLRRNDIYSYFVMPLVRALEAQMGTAVWLRKVLEAETSKEIPASAARLWLPTDPSFEQDVTRVLRRLFVSSSDVARRQVEQRGDAVSPLSENERIRDKDPEVGLRSAAGISGARSGRDPPPAAAMVAFPALIARYCKGGDEWEGQESGWLDSDEATCAAVEVDVHALAILVFMAWREFVSALPGCGMVLSREMSALWFAQIRQRWACQATLHTCSAIKRPPLDSAVTQPPSPALENSGRTSNVSGSDLGSPLLSMLEPEIAADHFGIAVRMACVDASAPYKLPLQDQIMFPDGDWALPVCLIQRYQGRDEDNGGRTAPEEEKGSGYGAGDADVATGSGSSAFGKKEHLVVASISPPLSPVWVHAHKPGRALGLASTLPAECSPRPAQTAPVSPVAAFARVLPLARAASSSPRAGGVGQAVGTLDSVTAAAAVKAAVAATTLTDDDRSRSASPVSPLARRFEGFGRRGRSNSSPRSGLVVDAAYAGAERRGVTGSPARGRAERTKTFKNLSPLIMRGRGFFPPSTARGKLLGRERGARAGKEGGRAWENNSSGNSQPGAEEKDARSTGHGKSDDINPCFNLAGGENDGTVLGGQSSRQNEMPPPPPPPPRPPPSLPNSTPPAARQARDAPSGRTSVTSARTVPPSPLRKSPVASPARPPPKPMAAEQERQHVEGGSTGAGNKVDRAGGGGSSLLDRVEQSSDLGAFFRQEAGRQGGARGGRGRGSSPRIMGVSPRAGVSRRALARGRRGSPRRGDFSAGGSRKNQGDGNCVEGEEEDEDEDEDDEEIDQGAGVGVHVIVLHHGYCGSSMDMRLIKNYIRILAPDAILLNAESNERDPHTSMKIMGEKLAKEVHRFLLVRARSLLLPGGQGRLSFIGHSAGAVIIRLALTAPILGPALGRLHMFVSLGSPHLGTVYGASGIVKTGMWAMKRWTKSKLLEELGLTDAAQPRDTLLCWLSQQPGLEYFRHVVLVSADKDGYVPPQSARIQMCDASIRDARKGVPHGQVVCEMTRAILASIDETCLYRLHLWGGEKQAKGGGGGMDEYIGRAAHISMMDSPSLVCLLLCTLLDIIR